MVALAFIHSVSQRSSGWLVDNAFYIQTSDTTSIFGGLTLAVVKVSWNSNYRLGNSFAQVVFGGFLHLTQDFGGDLWRRHFLTFYLNPSITVVSLGNGVRHHLDIFLYYVFVKTTTNQALDRIQSVLRVGYCLTLSRLTDQNFAIVGVGDDGWGGTTALGVFNNLGYTVFQYGNTGVSSTQVNTNNLAHVLAPNLLASLNLFLAAIA